MSDNHSPTQDRCPDCGARLRVLPSGLDYDVHVCIDGFGYGRQVATAAAGAYDQCPNCHTPVIPALTPRCPACDNRLFSAGVDPCTH